MKKKVYIILGLLLIIWGVFVIFFPVISIDGKFYTQRSIFQLKDQRISFFESSLGLLSDSVSNCIENEFSTYIDNVGNVVPFDESGKVLSKIIRDAFKEMNATEDKFRKEFQDILLNETWNFVVPLQVKDRASREVISNDIFSTNLKNYSIDNKIYYAPAIDILRAKKEEFVSVFPQITQQVIESAAEEQFTQCLDNLTARNDISTGINSLQNTIAFMREQGESLWFFQYLLEECDITDISNDQYSTTETFDILKHNDPVLFPVSVVNDTVYDALALKTVSEKTQLLRDAWKQQREENFRNILARQEKSMIQNWTSYIDIDENIDIEELSTLIEYYEKQSDISGVMFVEGLEQCRLSIDNADVYPNENTLDVFDTTPLQIDIINIEDNLYDAAAATALEASIETIRAEWVSISKKNIEKELNKYVSERNGNQPKNYSLVDLMSYYSYQIELSDAFFPYLLEQFKLNEDVSDFIGLPEILINVSPLMLETITIDDVQYSKFAVDLIQSIMADDAMEIMKDTRYQLTNDVNEQFDLCVNNVDSYLNWYYGFITSIGKTLEMLKGVVNPNKTAAESMQEYMVSNYTEKIGQGVDFKIVLDILQKSKDKMLNSVLIYSSALEMCAFNYTHPNEKPEIITGNDFMEPFIILPDYLNRIISEGLPIMGMGNKLDTDGILVLDLANLAINFIPGVGFIAGIGLDYVTLKLTEALKRPEFKEQITQSILDNKTKLLEVIQIEQ